MTGVTPWTILPESAPRSTPRWRRYPVTESSFVGVGVAEDIELFRLPAGEVIQAVKIKHSTAFSGGGALTATLSVGIVGNLVKYAAAFNVFTAPSATNHSVVAIIGGESHSAETSIRLNLAVTVGTTGGLTAGAADIWVLSGAAS